MSVKGYQFGNENTIAGVVVSTKDILDKPLQPKNQNHLVLISGALGTGKSVFSPEALPMVCQQQGFYLSGKFEL